MKPPKLAIFLFLGFTFAFSASAQRRGGIGDGGGNAMEESLAQPVLINEWLTQAKEPTLYSLHNVEAILQQFAQRKADDAAIYAKLFKGPKTIYKVLDESVFKPVATGGCEGVGTEEEKDANSLKDAPNICFSLENLAQKLHVFAGKVQLMALIVHELSHALGATETEAIEVQSLVQYNTGSMAFDKAHGSAENYRHNLAHAVATAKTIGSDDVRKKCLPEISLVTEIGTLFNDGANQVPDGLAVPSPRGSGFLFAAFIKAQTLMRACYGPGDSLGNLERDLFKGRKEVSLSETAATMGAGGDPWLPAGTVRRIDRKTAPKELADIVSYLQKVLVE
jgi:hypothetical protein